MVLCCRCDSSRRRPALPLPLLHAHTMPSVLPLLHRPDISLLDAAHLVKMALIAEAQPNRRQPVRPSAVIAALLLVLLTGLLAVHPRTPPRLLHLALTGDSVGDSVSDAGDGGDRPPSSAIPCNQNEISNAQHISARELDLQRQRDSILARSPPRGGYLAGCLVVKGAPNWGDGRAAVLGRRSCVGAPPGMLVPPPTPPAWRPAAPHPLAALPSRPSKAPSRLRFVASSFAADCPHYVCAAPPCLPAARGVVAGMQGASCCCCCCCCIFIQAPAPPPLLLARSLQTSMKTCLTGWTTTPGWGLATFVSALACMPLSF